MNNEQTSTNKVNIETQKDHTTGIYDGFIKFEGEHHTVNVPVSYVIVEKVEKDIPFTFIGKNNDVNFSNEYVKGAFDMTNRYMAGDWRQYYLDVQDNTINNASIELSWKNENTNFYHGLIISKTRYISSKALLYNMLLVDAESSSIYVLPFKSLSLLFGIKTYIEYKRMFRVVSFPIPSMYISTKIL